MQSAFTQFVEKKTPKLKINWTFCLIWERLVQRQTREFLRVGYILRECACPYSFLAIWTELPLTDVGYLYNWPGKMVYVYVMCASPINFILDTFSLITWQDSYKQTQHQDDVIKWKHFLRYWPFVREIHRWIPPTMPETHIFDVFFVLLLNKWLSKPKLHVMPL